MEDIPEFDKIRILQLKSEGLNYSQIDDCLHLIKGTASTFIRSWAKKQLTAEELIYERNMEALEAKNIRHRARQAFEESKKDEIRKTYTLDDNNPDIHRNVTITETKRPGSASFLTIELKAGAHISNLLGLEEAKTIVVKGEGESTEELERLVMAKREHAEMLKHPELDEYDEEYDEE